MGLFARFAACLLALLLFALRADGAGAPPPSGDSTATVGQTFTGADGNTSFIRLSNMDTTANKFAVTVVGSPSGQVYGTASITVPSGASPQYSLSQILSMAGASTLVNGDTSYSLYLVNGDNYAGYQHVIFNASNGFFENVSACNTLLGQGQLLTNVHTSLLAAYPSQIRLHNFSTQPATYRVSVQDAATGASIGTVDLSAAANASYVYPESYFEQQLHWIPTGSQVHVNLYFTAVSPSNFHALISHYIFNQQFQAYVNMSEICAINGTPDSAPGTNTLTVANTGNSNGTITSSPAGISCGTQCTASFASGTQVTLTPSPNTGSIFNGWLGLCSSANTGLFGSAPPCTVPVNGSVIVAGDFVPTPNTTFLINLTATYTPAGNNGGSIVSTPSGINCQGCTGAQVGFTALSTVTLNWFTIAGWTFTGWSGDCTGTGSCTLVMNKVHSVHASFVGPGG